MSAAEHRATTAEEERLAEEHEGRQYPNPRQVTGCGSATATEPTGIYVICWSTTTAAAQEHDKEAARHRAAAMELERAEATSRQSVVPDDVTSLLSTIDRISSPLAKFPQPLALWARNCVEHASSSEKWWA